MRTLLHPNRTVALGFLLAILLGTLLLMHPLATASGQTTTWLTAWFTAVSAVCVTGLVVVDTGTHWSLFGQAVVMLLFQLGGFGLMTAATLLGLMVNRSLRLKTRMIMQVETHAVGLGDVSSVAKVVLVVTLIGEAILAFVLAARLYFSESYPIFKALWYGVFHSVSAFNNAGFALYADSLIGYSSDAWILLPIMMAIVVGGIGFPVLHDLNTHWRDPRHWSLHTKLTLIGTLFLLVLGWLCLLFFEWSNPQTLGAMSISDKVLNAAFASVSARTAGFNAIDIAALERESLALHYFLMFIGGGSAGTAGGAAGKEGRLF